MTHELWCAVFFYLLALLRRPAWHTIFTGNLPKSPKSAQKRGTHVFDHFVGKFPPWHPTFRTIQPEKCGFFPIGAILGGAALRGSFARFGGVLGWELLKIVFLEGGHLTPCSATGVYRGPL